MTACPFTEHFKPIVETCFPEKKLSFKISLLIDNELGHPRALMEVYSEMNIVFMPPNTASVTRVYVPRFFVSSQQRFGATDIKALGASQLLGLGQTVLQLLSKSVLQLYFI